ncbi:MAG: pyridoxal-phosphate dependent enzyme [Candidatus Lokiarchaeota archaeon]|nr:pyridoxal-phosphate dependent enzyme [Candidatus Lokiarchaeota archaeon]
MKNSPYLRPIIKQFKAIKKLSWTKLTNLPTPIEPLKGLEKKLKFNHIWIKRDDITSPHYGGNKSRKLEYLLAGVKKEGKQVIKTVGGIGSNHAVATSIFCKQLGMKCKLFLIPQPNSEHCRTNLLLDYYYGAELNYCEDASEYPEDIDIPRGGTSPLGNLGYVNAALELKEQIDKNILPEPDIIFVTKGSSGTLAGLLLGFELLGLKTKLYGVTIIDSNTKEDVITYAMQTWKLMKHTHHSLPEIEYENLKNRLVILDEFYGDGYGYPTEKGENAIRLIKKTDDILLDSTYTGKTMSAMISFINENKKDLLDTHILFWNTFNSISQSKEINKVQFRDLPKKFHPFFNGKIPIIR